MCETRNQCPKPVSNPGQLTGVPTNVPKSSGKILTTILYVKVCKMKILNI